MVSRGLALVYGVIAYVAFVVVFVYAMGFVANLGVPRGIDGPLDGPLAVALGIDLALLTLFAVQHSVMARRGFKALWTRVVPEPVERSTYVLAASACLAVLFWQWRPLGGVVWQVDDPRARTVIHAVAILGWITVLAATWLINHFELFGLAQVWRHFRGTRALPPAFATPGLYRSVRHPLYLGFIVAFWAAPTMSATHLLFAAVTTAYILVAIQFEERDLIVAHPEYAAYRRQVPMLVPGLGRRDTSGDLQATAAASRK